MNGEKKELMHYLQSCKGFDVKDAINLVLVARGAKNACFVPLKISTKNLDDKHHFEKHLNKSRFEYNVSRARGYEQIDAIKGNRIKWNFKGIWFGYDVFISKKYKKMFGKHMNLVKKHNMMEADKVGGDMYNYPKCCIKNFILERNPEFIKKKYTCYKFYKKLHDLDRKFPFIFHTPCSLNCRQTKKLNEKYKQTIKKSAPKLFEIYSKTKKSITPVIFDSESDIYGDKMAEKKSIWPKKDGHEYSIITKKPIENHHFILAYLSKKTFGKGDCHNSTITVKYDYADIDLKNKLKSIKGLHHERKILAG